MSDAPREIPGYYYDVEKKKYFKILQNHKAPKSGFVTKEFVRKKTLQKEWKEFESKRKELTVKPGKSLFEMSNQRQLNNQSKHNPFVSVVKRGEPTETTLGRFDGIKTVISLDSLNPNWNGWFLAAVTTNIGFAVDFKLVLFGPDQEIILAKFPEMYPGSIISCQFSYIEPIGNHVSIELVVAYAHANVMRDHKTGLLERYSLYLSCDTPTPTAKPLVILSPSKHFELEVTSAHVFNPIPREAFRLIGKSGFWSIYHPSLKQSIHVQHDFSDPISILSLDVFIIAVGSREGDITLYQLDPSDKHRYSAPASRYSEKIMQFAKPKQLIKLRTKTLGSAVTSLDYHKPYLACACNDGKVLVYQVIQGETLSASLAYEIHSDIPSHLRNANTLDPVYIAMPAIDICTPYQDRNSLLHDPTPTFDSMEMPYLCLAGLDGAKDSHLRFYGIITGEFISKVDLKGPVKDIFYMGVSTGPAYIAIVNNQVKLLQF